MEIEGDLIQALAIGLWHWKVLFVEGLVQAYMHFLKIPKLSEFLTLESKLCHSVIVEGEKNLNSHVQH